jgi:imidazoleglycerol-phosphate dehydratase
MERKSIQKRKTNETEVEVILNLDGEGKTKIDTGIDFLNHMLDLFSFFAMFDLEIKATGDVNIDIHHSNEDIGITLGKTIKDCLKDGEGINRFGYAYAPMDDVLVRAVVDISGRPCFEYSETNTLPGSGIKTNTKDEYTLTEAEHFLESISQQCGLNINIGIVKGSADAHHVMEAIFKAFGLALKQACSIDPRRKGITSTKGVIDL